MTGISRKLSIAIAAASLGIGGAATAQTFSTLYQFGAVPDGQAPRGMLAQGRDGSLLGTTLNGGASNEGAVFSLGLDGKEGVLASFADSSGGIHCNSGIVIGTDGNFYGACPDGSAPNNFGTVFEYAGATGLFTLHSFDGTDGQLPDLGAPVQGSDGRFYGVTEAGGVNNAGTAFAVGADGSVSVLYNFGGSKGDASGPSGPLMLSSDGNFYGTTMSGGAAGAGTVFSMTPTGQLTILHSFATSKKDGSGPSGGVVQDKSGTLYGVTFGGGANNLGTVYALSTKGKNKTLHDFSTSDVAWYPCDSLALATDRNLYGGASTCIDGKCGTAAVFEVTTKGQFKVLHTLDPATEGTKISGPLLLDTNGTFYGTTEQGGSSGNGTVFSLNTGLAPFASLSPSSGAEGATIGIYGQGFTQKGTKVSFAGTNAAFKEVTPNFLQAVVPSGAASGTVTVKTPGGKLKSLQTFTVSR
jgi:uncharacterized repeat protein (TIGR03803 family)